MSETLDEYFFNSESNVLNPRSRCGKPLGCILSLMSFDLAATCCSKDVGSVDLSPLSVFIGVVFVNWIENCPTTEFCTSTIF